MTRKAKAKIIISVIVLIAILAGSVVAVLFLTKAPEKPSYTTSFVAKEDIYAKINGQSFISSNSTPIESFSQVVFNGNVTEETKTATFSNEIKVENADDSVDFIYTIQNTTELITYSDLFVEPKITIDNNNISCNVFLKVEGEYLEISDKEYIVLEKNETATIKVSFSGTAITEKINYSMSFNLFGERELASFVKVVYADKNDFARYYKGTTYKLSEVWKLPAEQGKTFAGWYTDITLTTNAPSNISGEVRLFAKFINN